MRLFFWFISSLLSLHNKAQCISRGSVHFSLLPILFYIQDTETSQSWGRSSPRCQSHSPFCFCSVEGVMPCVCCQSCENANITGNSHSWVSPNPLSGIGLLLKLGKTGKKLRRPIRGLFKGIYLHWLWMQICSRAITCSGQRFYYNSSSEQELLLSRHLFLVNPYVICRKGRY